jgi:hypothetical protein
MKKNLTVVIAINLAIALTGCGSSWYVKRDIKKLDGLSIQYPTEFARLSNELNPCFTGTLKSDTVVQRSSDTVINSIEHFVVGEPGKHDTLYLPGKTIRNNIYITIHDTIPDNRALNACAVISKKAADSLLIIKTQSSQLRTDKGSLIKWVIALGIAILAIIGINIYKFFSGGAVAGIVKKAL